LSHQINTTTDEFKHELYCGLVEEARKRADVPIKSADLWLEGRVTDTCTARAL